MSEIVLHHDDGSETVLPHRWVICSSCEGEGKSSAYLGAFTRDQLDEEGPEFIEDYFAGHYDRACDRCGGAGKVKVADTKAMTRAQRAEYREQERQMRECREIERQERLFEGGWREEGWFGS